MNRVVVALGPAAAIALLAVLAEPLGPLRGTLLLVVALPPLAQTLAALGWTEVLARRLAALGGPRPVLLGAYLAWLAVSALLGLDAAAVLAVPVGLSLARRGLASTAEQVDAAIYGSNVGSLLFPFSNLTNLLVVAASGVSFASFVAAAAVPQLAATLAVGGLLWWRLRGRSVASSRVPEAPPVTTFAGLLAGGVALLAAMAALALGFAGGDVVLAFVVGSSVVAGIGLLAGGTSVRQLATGLPLSAIGIVLVAALLRGPAAHVAGLLPSLAGASIGPLGLLGIALVGGLLASVANNLPAALFGSVWLVGAPVHAVVAYLVGTNLLAVSTPHGSVATMLCRSLANRNGAPQPIRVHLASAWRYAGAASTAACIVLLLVG